MSSNCKQCQPRKRYHFVKNHTYSLGYQEELAWQLRYGKQKTVWTRKTICHRRSTYHLSCRLPNRIISLPKYGSMRSSERPGIHFNPEQFVLSVCIFLVTIFIMMMTQLWLLFVLLLLHVSSSTASLKDDCSCDILNKPSLWHKEETARYVENHFHDVFYDKRDDCGTDHFIARFKIFQPDGWSILSIGVSFQRYPLELSNL